MYACMNSSVYIGRLKSVDGLTIVVMIDDAIPIILFKKRGKCQAHQQTEQPKKISHRPVHSKPHTALGDPPKGKKKKRTYLKAKEIVLKLVNSLTNSCL